jgi:hypothetical protein
MAKPIIEIELEIDSTGTQKAFKKVEADAKKTGSSLGKSLSDGFSSFGLDFKSIATGAVVVAGATAAFRAFSNVLSLGFKEAVATENAINELNQALKATSKFSPDASVELIRFAEGLSNISTFGDDAIISTSALIQSLGDLDKNGLKRATAAALDLASGLNIDLRSAAVLVGKAASGEISSFTRYGLAISKGADSTETFANALNALEARFSGAAQSKVNTFSGALSQLNIAFGDLSKAVVGYITNSGLINSAIRLTTDLLRKTTDLINPSRETLSEKLNVATGALEELRKKEEQYSKTASINRLGMNNRSQDMLESTQKEIMAQEKLIATLRLQVAENAKLEALAGRKKEAPGLTDDQLKQLAQQTQAIGLTQEEALTQTLINQEELLRKAFDNRILNESDFFIRSFELNSQYYEKLDALRLADDEKRKAKEEAERNALLNSAIQFDTFFEQVGAGFADFSNQVFVSGKQIASTVLGGIGNAAGSAFASFGAALVKGENALEAFAKSFIASIGQIAVQQGTAFILQGIAYQFIPGQQATGSALIAAGAALATFGGALSAFAGGGGGETAGAGGGISPGFEQSTLTDERQQEERRADQSVQLIVQGDILDSEDTGRRLIRLLNDNFESEASALTAVRFA